MEVIKHLKELTALMAVDTESDPLAMVVCGTEKISTAVTLLFDAYKPAAVHRANLTIQTEGPWTVYERAENGVITGTQWEQPVLAPTLPEGEQPCQ